MTGVVSRMFLSKGFGFVRDENGHTRFMHANDFVRVYEFDTLREGQTVNFTPVEVDTGLRAIEVTLVNSDPKLLLDRR